MKLFKRLPELQILLITTLGCYVFLEMYVDPSQSNVISSLSGVDLIITSFVLSVVIAIVAVIAGVGGGVIFTPLMLAFTSIDTLIIRSTGLVVAMFSGLVATGPFMRKGLADIKLVFLGGAADPDRWAARLLCRNLYVKASWRNRRLPRQAFAGAVAAGDCQCLCAGRCINRIP